MAPTRRALAVASPIPRGPRRARLRRNSIRNGSTSAALGAVPSAFSASRQGSSNAREAWASAPLRDARLDRPGPLDPTPLAVAVAPVQPGRRRLAPAGAAKVASPPSSAAARSGREVGFTPSKPSRRAAGMGAWKSLRSRRSGIESCRGRTTRAGADLHCGVGPLRKSRCLTSIKDAEGTNGA